MNSFPSSLNTGINPSRSKYAEIAPMAPAEYVPPLQKPNTPYPTHGVGEKESSRKGGRKSKKVRKSKKSRKSRKARKSIKARKARK